MSTATITRTTVETVELDLNSPLWPANMTDQEKLTGWLFAARMEPDAAFCGLDITTEVSIEGVVNELPH